MGAGAGTGTCVGSGAGAVGGSCEILGSWVGGCLGSVRSFDWGLGSNSEGETIGGGLTEGAGEAEVVDGTLRGYQWPRWPGSHLPV